jgi:hypothetical protein
MAWRDPDNLNVKRVPGAPPQQLASPITTSFGPADKTPLGDIIGIPDPADTMSNCRVEKGKSRSKRA